MRSIILHGHIFKNAGSAFDTLLNRSFGAGFVDHRDDRDLRLGGVEYLDQFIRRNKQIKAISSHHMVAGLGDCEDYRIKYVYFLRHPIERCLSVYEFEKMQESNSLGARAAKKMSFSEYVKWRLNVDVPPTIRNYHVRYLTNFRINRKQPSLSDLSIAKDQLSLSLFGIVSDYRNSLKYIAGELKNAFNVNIPFEVKRVNSTHTIASMSHDDRINFIHEVLGDALYNEYCESNSLDLLLYEWAMKKYSDKL